MDNVVEQGCFLVLAGDFNPAIFTPHWMATQDIVSLDEANSSNIEVVHKELARFSVANLRFEVLPSRCIIFAEAEPFVRLVDTAALLFLRSLSHTPVRGVALNYYVHVDLKDPLKRMKFGRLLAPPPLWQEIGLLKPEEAGREQDGGMSDLTIQQPMEDGRDGYLQAIVQPSYRIQGNRGLFVQVSDNYGLMTEQPEAEDQQSDSASSKRKSRAKIVEKADATEPVNYVDQIVRDFDSSFQKISNIARGVVSAAEKIQ